MNAIENFLQSKRKVVYVLLLLFCFLPMVTPPVALFTGLVFALVCGEAFPGFTKKSSKYLLQVSVVGLGFGMNLHESLASGREGMVFTVISVVGTLLIGSVLARRMQVDRKTGYLISSGTAICGGSAIAAVGPVIKANDHEMSVSLGAVFILNAVALFLFPVLGHLLDLTQQQFGMWAAIAIHDTSSVVGAGAAYGDEALKVATTVKLTRALWIIPVAFVTSLRRLFLKVNRTRCICPGLSSCLCLPCLPIRFYRYPLCLPVVWFGWRTKGLRLRCSLSEPDFHAGCCAG